MADLCSIGKTRISYFPHSTNFNVSYFLDDFDELFLCIGENKLTFRFWYYRYIGGVKYANKSFSGKFELNHKIIRMHTYFFLLNFCSGAFFFQECDWGFFTIYFIYNFFLFLTLFSFQSFSPQLIHYPRLRFSFSHALKILLQFLSSFFFIKLFGMTMPRFGSTSEEELICHRSVSHACITSF